MTLQPDSFLYMVNKEIEVAESAPFNKQERSPFSTSVASTNKGTSRFFSAYPICIDNTEAIRAEHLFEKSERLVVFSDDKGGSSENVFSKMLLFVLFIWSA